MIKSFKNALNGLRSVLNEERNFKVEVCIGFLVIVAAAYFRFTLTEWIVIVICIASVVCAEIVNTAIEDLCDKVEPNTDPAIGRVKDMMAAFVLVAALGAAIVGALVFYNHFQ